MYSKKAKGKVSLGLINLLQLRVYVLEMERKTTRSPWATSIHIEWLIPTNLAQGIGTIKIGLGQLWLFISLIPLQEHVAWTKFGFCWEGDIECFYQQGRMEARRPVRRVLQEFRWEMKDKGRVLGAAIFQKWSKCLNIKD